MSLTSQWQVVLIYINLLFCSCSGNTKNIFRSKDSTQVETKQRQNKKEYVPNGKTIDQMDSLRKKYIQLVDKNGVTAFKEKIEKRKEKLSDMKRTFEKNKAFMSAIEKVRAGEPIKKVCLAIQDENVQIYETKEEIESVILNQEDIIV